MTRALREQFKTALHYVFLMGQRAGWDILPRHYYSAIPSIQELKGQESWKRPSSMFGVAGTDLESQFCFLHKWCFPLQEQLRKGRIYERACLENGEAGYGPTEADVLFAFIATKRPSKIIQVGCGVSTAVMLLAAKHANYKPCVVCIDPHPTAYVTRLAENREIDLLREKAQNVDSRVFTGLAAGDLLFVDSTHTIAPGSEVNRIILDILPRLPHGCFAHFHDIFFPYDYQSNVLTTLFFWGESTLLHAFLINNSRFSIAVSLSMLHHACPQRLSSVLPNYEPAALEYGLETERKRLSDFPSATYLSVS